MTEGRTTITTAPGYGHGFQAGDSVTVSGLHHRWYKRFWYWLRRKPIPSKTYTVSAVTSGNCLRLGDEGGG